MNWQPEPDDDCDGCNMMKAMTVLNKKLASSQTERKEKKKEEGGDGKNKENEKEEIYELKEDDRPLDLNQLGNATWGLLHTMAAYYPQKPSPQRQQLTKTFLETLGDVFPCHVCGDDWKDVLKHSPPIVSSQPEFSTWLCEAHNDINVRLGKPKFPCQFADARWRASFFDHSEEKGTKEPKEDLGQQKKN